MANHKLTNPGIDDGEAVALTHEMFGTMLLTAFSMLAEHDLLTPTSPIQNIGLVSACFLDIALDWKHGFDQGLGEVDWVVPVVRALDKAGIDIPMRKEFSAIKEERLAEVRERVKQQDRDWADNGVPMGEVGDDKRWRRERDTRPANRGGEGERLWRMWDWKKEVRDFFIGP